MNFQLDKLTIKDSFLLEGVRYDDSRGSFEESYNVNTFKEVCSMMDLDISFVQDNLSWSKQNVVRGLHIQRNNPQGKFVRCLLGHVVDVFVDLRPDSKTFKYSQFVELRGEFTRSVYVPPGCAHGFIALAPMNLVSYKCTTPYDKLSDGGINYADKELAIEWDRFTKDSLIVSDKDMNLPSVEEWLKG